jgi:hypothetical protein
MINLYNPGVSGYEINSKRWFSAKADANPTREGSSFKFSLNNF